ncbi:MAG: hypothetical protein HY735_07590 [Verrucomicrobia bacterium]|nr:hypothetical protein [Verrucomicrobiota bacterium]
MTKSMVTLGILAWLATPLRAQLIWVNEFHYDNAGSDVGEFFEIAAPSSISDLSSVTLTLYRGSDGTSSASHKLSTFNVGSSSDGYTFYSKSISGIQNGAPDGFALDQSGSVLQFLSYEGVFQATSGAASGLTSTDIGVAESSATSVGTSIGLTGTGYSYADFLWTSFADDTAGSLNSGQAFSAAPEPGESALMAAVGLLGFALVRRWWMQRHPEIVNP